jgi:hypothetical protein
MNNGGIKERKEAMPHVPGVQIGSKSMKNLVFDTAKAIFQNFRSTRARPSGGVSFLVEADIQPASQGDLPCVTSTPSPSCPPAC